MPRAQDPTQSLLRWGIEHAEPGALAKAAEDMKTGKRPDLSTDMLKAIMGTSDADRMRECVMVIEGKWVDRDAEPGKQVPRLDAEVTVEDRYRAWDDLEMLVEDLDNANDLKSIGAWKPIVSHLTDPDDEIVMRACWVCGTAVQNNPRSLETFLTYDPLPTLASLIASSSASTATRARAMYCLSSTLKHCEPAVARFAELGGYARLSDALHDPALTIRTKTAFLLSQLVAQAERPDDLVDALRSSGTIQTLLDSLSVKTALPTDSTGSTAEIDADFRDKGLRFVVNVVERTGGKGLVDAEKDQVRSILNELKAAPGGWNVEEDLGVSKGEWDAFENGLRR